MPLLLSTAMLLLAAQEREPVGEGPEPSPTPISWEVEFRYLPPRRIQSQGAGGLQTYWYMVYTAVNRSSTTQRFFPICQLVTEDLAVIDTDSGISPLVFDAIRERHRGTHKYLTHPTKAIGPLRVGEGNARESVAIWRDVDLKGATFKIYVAGLSGEAQLVENPRFDATKSESESNPRYFTLRKTLELTYRFPASEATRPLVEPDLLGSRWVMR
jgi:hypothetical protein